MGWRFKRTPCTRKAVQVKAVEAGVAAFYETFQVPPARVAEIRVAVHAELFSERTQAELDAERAKQRLLDARGQREKLLQAHYAGAVPLDMLKIEMSRLMREISTAEQELATAQTSVDDLEGQLERALTVAGNCARHYGVASPAVRRMMNQGFFTKLYIDVDGDVERADLTDPFASLVDTLDAGEAVADGTAASDTVGVPATPSAPEPTVTVGADGGLTVTVTCSVSVAGQQKAPERPLSFGGSKLISLAEAEGFEPPDGCPSPAFKAGAFGRSATLPWGGRVAGQSSGVAASMAPMRSKILARVACWVSVVRLIMCRRTPST